MTLNQYFWKGLLSWYALSSCFAFMHFFRAQIQASDVLFIWPLLAILQNVHKIYIYKYRYITHESRRYNRRIHHLNTPSSMYKCICVVTWPYLKTSGCWPNLADKNSSSQRAIHSIRKTTTKRNRTRKPTPMLRTTHTFP